MNTPQTARREDWTIQPMPDRHAVLEMDIAYTAWEMARIRRGLIPHEMEDKWFIFYEGQTLHVHRSWTGFCIFEAEFAPDGEVFRVAQLRCNRDPDQYRITDDAYDRADFPHLVRVLLLSDG